MHINDMMENYPLVSVIIPCYNHEKYIGQCIQSVVNQSYSNIEILVLDDGSKDNSFTIIKQLSKQYGFFAESHANIGLSATLNKGIQQYAKGKYVCIVASDDYWEYTKIEKQIAFYEKNSEVGFIFGKTHVVDTNGNLIDEGIEKIPNFGAFAEQLRDNYIPECTFTRLLKANFVPALTVMIKKEVFYKVGYFDESLAIEDWDMWLRISHDYPFLFIDEFLGFYRVHTTNTTNNRIKMVDASRKILMKWKALEPSVVEIVETDLLYEITEKCVSDKKRAAQLIFSNMGLFFRYKAFRKSFKRLFFKFREKRNQ